MNKYNDFLKIILSDSDKSTNILFKKPEIIRILSENNDEIKPFAIINLKSIDNFEEAKLFLFHLTDHDGRIREAVSFMLNEIENLSVYFEDENSLRILTKGILDINPNVVRGVISFIENNENIKEKITEYILIETENALRNLLEYLRETKFKENRAKNHAKNKFTFNLYWLLSAISILDVNKIENLNEILTKTGNFLDYTIREKTALILSKMDNPPLKLLRELKNDENIYVKNQLL